MGEKHKHNLKYKSTQEWEELSKYCIALCFFPNVVGTSMIRDHQKLLLHILAENQSLWIHLRMRGEVFSGKGMNNGTMTRNTMGNTMDTWRILMDFDLFQKAWRGSEMLLFLRCKPKDPISCHWCKDKAPKLEKIVWTFRCCEIAKRIPPSISPVLGSFLGSTSNKRCCWQSAPSWLPSGFI